MVIVERYFIIESSTSWFWRYKTREGKSHKWASYEVGTILKWKTFELGRWAVINDGNYKWLRCLLSRIKFQPSKNFKRVLSYMSKVLCVYLNSTLSFKESKDRLINTRSIIISHLVFNRTAVLSNSLELWNSYHLRSRANEILEPWNWARLNCA